MDATLLLKATLLLLLTLLTARVLCRAAVTRHLLWTLGFAALLALPLLASALPALYVPVPAGWRASTVLRTPPNTFGEFANPGVPPPGSQGERLQSPSLVTAWPASPERTSRAAREGGPTARTLLLVVWLIGTTGAVAALLLSLFRARRLALEAEEVGDPAWQRTADMLGARLGLQRPARLLMSHSVGMPMAGGVWRPVIYLPASARAWSAERRDVVLAHEIVHLAGRDPLRHVVARLAVGVYWFHPLAWIAARQATAAREEACDEAVLALGTRPSAYARVLLDLAESVHASAPGLGALPMIEHSVLERRLMAILNNNAPSATGRRGLIPVLGVLLTLSVSAAQPST